MEAEKGTLIAAHAIVIEAGVVNPAPVGKAKEKEKGNPLAIPTTSFKKPNARNPKGKRRMARKIAKFAGTINWAIVIWKRANATSGILGFASGLLLVENV